MNILVWSSWVRPPAGGQERMALELALRLHQHGHRVCIVGAYENAPELRAKIPADLPFYHFDLHRRRFKRHAAATRLLQRVAAKHSAQVISAHGNIFAPHAVSVLRKLPLVWTVHGAAPVPQGPAAREGCMARVKSAAVRRVMDCNLTHVVAVSQSTAENVCGHFSPSDRSRLHVIHNGVIEDAALLALPLPEPGPPWHLGFIGRLVEGKGPLDLVELGRILSGSLDFRIHVFGDGPLMEPLRRAIQRSALQNNFVLHGYWDKGAAGMIAPLHLLVHPSRQEGFGSALLEAQMGGRPVVAYDVGGNPENVANGTTGLLAPTGNVEKMAEAIGVIAAKQFRGFSTAARQHAQKRFRFDRMVGEYVELFERVCASH